MTTFYHFFVVFFSFKFW